MKKILTLLGGIYLGLLACLIFVSAIGILISKGIWEFWNVFSPFNIINWAVTAVIALPGLALLAVGKKQ